MSIPWHTVLSKEFFLLLILCFYELNLFIPSTGTVQPRKLEPRKLEFLGNYEQIVSISEVYF